MKFHAGSSDQEAAAKKQYNQVSQYNPTVENRYNNAKLFGAKDMFGKVDEYTKMGEDVIKKDTAGKVKDAGQSTAAAGQSRGYGGSILEDMIAKSKSKANEGGTSALQQLMLKRLGMAPGIMGQANQTELGRLGGATGVDMGNAQNMFNKFAQQMGAIGGLSDDTWLDDLMGGLNTAGSVATSVAAIASDRRLKENIVKTGTKNGINIYEFNYIGNPKRFSGVMADEVPQASVNVNGYGYVDYSLLPGIEFKEI